MDFPCLRTLLRSGSTAVVVRRILEKNQFVTAMMKGETMLYNARICCRAVMGKVATVRYALSKREG